MAGLDLLFCFSVCCAGCNFAGRSPPDGCADGCRYVWNIARGAVAELCHGMCQVCQGPMLFQPELKGHFNPGSWGLVALLSSLNPLHRSRTQSCFTFHWGIDVVMGTRKETKKNFRGCIKKPMTMESSNDLNGKTKWEKGKWNYRNEKKSFIIHVLWFNKTNQFSPLRLFLWLS